MANIAAMLGGKLSLCWLSLVFGAGRTPAPQAPIEPARLREEKGRESLFIDFLPTSARITPADLHYKTKTLREVDEVLGNLRSPRLTKIAFLENYRWGSFAELEGRIRTGTSSVGKLQPDGRNHDPSTAHEFAHAVFALNFFEKLLTHPKVQQNYQAEWYQRLTTSVELRAYNELFADFVAVLASNDPRAIAHYLLEASDHQHLPERIVARDFSFEIPAEGWTSRDPYLIFAPTRSYLGRNLWKKDLSLETRGGLAERLMQAIVDEFADFYQDPRLLTRASVAELNKRLMTRLESPREQPLGPSLETGKRL